MGDPTPVILNPFARSGRAGGGVEMIRRFAGEIAIHETRGPGDATRLARRLADSGASVVVAAGGDGTVNEVIRGLAASPQGGSVALGILPTGTMNVFASDLGLPVHRLDECWSVIRAGKVREIDLWRANDEYFVQLAGVGFDASVIERVTWAMKRRFGPLSYLIEGWRRMREASPPVDVELADGTVLKGKLVLLGNGCHYGGPFRLFPKSSFSDGLLDGVVLQEHGWSALARLGWAMLRGRSQGIAGVTYFQSTALTVTATDVVPFQVDGEVGGKTPVAIRRAPCPLRVVIP
jgi:diacylglycerol kinase (ATP)